MSQEAIDLILHPGHSKCGSSTLQEELYGRGKADLRRHGIYLPGPSFRFSFEGELPASVSSPLIPAAYFEEIILGRRPAEEFSRRLDEALACARGTDCRTLLISSENLCSVTHAPAVELHKVLASRFPRRKIVYYIRRYDELFQAGWIQWGHKEGKSFRDYIDFLSEYYAETFLRNADAFETIYGRDNLEIVPVHPSALHQENLISDFFHRIGVEPTGNVIPGERKNVSLNPYLCEILSRVPHLYQSIHDTRIRRLFERHLGANDLLYARHPDFMPFSLRRRVMQRREVENRELHRRFFPHLDFDEIFGLSPVPLQEEREARLRDEMDGLKEVLALQIELILRLLDAEKDTGRSPET